MGNVLAGQTLKATDVQNESGDESVCSAALTVGTSAADITGATKTFNTPVANTVVLITGTFDVNISVASSAVFTGTAVLDGTSLTGQAIFQQITSAGRGTVSQFWVVTIAAAGSHTVKLQGAKSAATGTITVQTSHTKIGVTGAGIS